MAVYKYTGVISDGTEVSGRIDAIGKKDALRMLRSKQIQPVDLSQVKKQVRKLKSKTPNSADYYQLLKQFSVLVDANVPVLDGLVSLQNSVAHQIIYDELEMVAKQLRAGLSLGDAMQSHMSSFPGFVYNLIKLGEKTGRLGAVLRLLSDQLALQEKMRRDLKDALTYPLFLIAVGVIAVLFIFIVVVPGFSDMVADSREELPLISQTIFSISDVMVANPGKLTAILATIIFLIFYGYKLPQVRPILNRIRYNSPVLGSLLKTIDISNWTRTVAISVGARSNFLEAVELANDSLGSPIIKSAYQEVVRDLRAGLTIDQALLKIDTVEPAVQSLVATGVKSGKLGEMLFVATEILDERVRAQAERIGKLAEPISILIISGIIGLVVISLVLSMTSLYDVAL